MLIYTLPTVSHKKNAQEIGILRNFRDMTQKSSMLILVLRDNLLNGKLCGVLLFPEYFYFAEKIPKYRIIPTLAKNPFHHHAFWVK